MGPDASAAERLGEQLCERGETLAVAESCTGGLLGSTITDVPGASEYFLGGILSYTDGTKRRLLAVSRESLEEHGAVSRPVARSMATHVRDEAGADWALSTTGYAGASDDPEEPAGSVYVGVACAGTGDGPFSVVERHQFDGPRQHVKERVTERALESLLVQVQSAE
jgi:nicotinamide-nucleotide amidase